MCVVLSSASYLPQALAKINISTSPGAKERRYLTNFLTVSPNRLVYKAVSKTDSCTGQTLNRMILLAKRTLNYGIYGEKELGQHRASFQLCTTLYTLLSDDTSACHCTPSEFRRHTAPPIGFTYI